MKLYFKSQILKPDITIVIFVSIFLALEMFETVKNTELVLNVICMLACSLLLIRVYFYCFYSMSWCGSDIFHPLMFQSNR